jgi:PrcB C-terminal
MNLQPPVLLFFAVLLLAGSVSGAWADSFPIRTLAKGAFSGIQEPKQEVIKDRAAFEKLWAKHLAGGKSAATLPDVDFSKDMVILVTLGRKNTGGYSIRVTSVEPVGNKLLISVRRTSPRPGAMAIQVLTSPFDMVVVPKSDLAPEFVAVNTSENKKPVGQDRAAR